MMKNCITKKEMMIVEIRKNRSHLSKERHHNRHILRIKQTLSRCHKSDKSSFHKKKIKTRKHSLKVWPHLGIRSHSVTVFVKRAFVCVGFSELNKASWDVMLHREQLTSLINFYQTTRTEFSTKSLTINLKQTQ